MNLNISGILKTKGAALPFEFQERLFGFGFPASGGAVALKGAVESMGGSFRINGEGSFIADLACDRCLAPIKAEINFKFTENIPEDQTDEKDTAARLIGSNVIDIRPLVAESILSAIPMKALCREDCRGLCPMCGQDLNESDCSCESSNIDPRFESLRSFFNVK